jgi:hypothetical protein
VLFVKYLRDAVRAGEVTTTVRVWQRPHVRVGKRYRMEDGKIEIDSIVPITFDDINPDLARACGFRDVTDLLTVARHGSGANIYLIRFHYIAPDAPGTGARSSPRPRKVKAGVRGRRRPWR